MTWLRLLTFGVLPIGPAAGAGLYACDGLRHGLCKVSFPMPGFATSVGAITLEPGSTAELDATLPR